MNEDNGLILYRFDTIGTTTRGGIKGKIEIIVHPPLSSRNPLSSISEIEKDAKNLFQMLQSYFPNATVSLIRRAFLSEASNGELIQELRKRLWT